MINKSDAYKVAIVGDTRRIYINTIIDIVDPDITYGTATAQSESIYSKSGQLHGKDFSEPKKYATLEDGRWTLDGDFDIYPTDPADLTAEMGYMSETLSGSDGAFETAQWVQLNFSNCSILQACSIWFTNNSYDGVPEEFKVEVFCGTTAYYTKNFTGNTESSVSCGGFTVYDPTAIKVTVTKMSKAYRRFRCIEIVPGIYEKWTEDDVYQLDIKQQVDFACTSIPYGVCTLKMDNKSRRFEPRSKSGVFSSIEDRQPISVELGVLLADGTIDYTSVGVFYQYSTGWKTGENGLTMQWDLVDIIGLLADRKYAVPASLPTTLTGWIADLVGQLGTAFASRYTIDSAYASAAITVNAAADLQGMTCGDVLRYLCMAAGCFPRADSETGFLAVEPLWSAGGYFELDNLSTYPRMAANADAAAVVFNLYDGSDTVYTVSGNSAASSHTISVKNPFIHTTAAAITAARNILTMYGGNIISISGRGDMASECGDVDSIQLNESVATSARRYMQQFMFNDGVMKNLPSELLQANGIKLYKERVVLTGSGTWTGPSGVTSLFIVLVSGGNGGVKGTNGSWGEAGEKGADGAGGKVYYATININSGQSLTYSCGSGGAANGGPGASTTFGAYSSADGSLYNGYTDIQNGDVYARDGVGDPAAGSGDGGRGGAAGRAGRTHEETVEAAGISTSITVIDCYPTPGGAGKAGAAGCIVIYYDKG